MYVGRFAPSPTGPLHFGSLIAAVGSYLEARTHRGHWLLRMEDIDPPREQAGAADQILKTLELFGFQWHGAVMYQSRRLDAYRAILEQLNAEGKTYPCICSRKQIEASGSKIYPGTCRKRKPAITNTSASIRLRATDKTIEFTDALQGKYRQDLLRDVGDFNLLRRDGLYSYHLAVTVDDAEQNISHIVRGMDLLESTPRQIYLQQQAGFNTPAYMHLPIATNADGQKLSKQNFAAAIDSGNISILLWQALAKLGQRPPQDLNAAPTRHIWEWAIEHWSCKNIPRQATFVYDEKTNNKNESDKT